LFGREDFNGLAIGERRLCSREADFLEEDRSGRVVIGVPVNRWKKKGGKGPSVAHLSSLRIVKQAGEEVEENGQQDPAGADQYLASADI